MAIFLYEDFCKDIMELRLTLCKKLKFQIKPWITAAFQKLNSVTNKLFKRQTKLKDPVKNPV